jgi:hypothetical protein
MYDAEYERQYTNKRRGGEISQKTEPNIRAGKGKPSPSASPLRAEIALRPSVK